MDVDDLTHYMQATSRMRVRAEQAEAERDQLREQVATLREALENVAKSGLATYAKLALAATEPKEGEGE